jgi:hypothetical protein
MQLPRLHTLRTSRVLYAICLRMKMVAVVVCALVFHASTASAQESNQAAKERTKSKSTPVGIKRRDMRNEQELLAQLKADAVELDVRAHPDFCERLAALGRQAVLNEMPNRRNPSAKRSSALPAAVNPTLALIKRREDLAGLPLREGGECQKEPPSARLMQEISGKVQATIREYHPNHTEGLAIRYPDDNGLVPPLAKVARAYDRDHLSTLIQMFQPQAAAVRMKLVELLAAASELQATVFLAERAIFDPSAQVREAAVTALKARSPDEYRLVLLKGLRYPWAPVADHAAEALVALQDRDVLPRVAELLDERDPSSPTVDKNNRRGVPQLVAVNHLRNCLLCHAPSFNNSDPVRGAVPVPGRSLSPRYYDGDGPQTIFVRADITYLQQDFSAFQQVLSDEFWPNLQRFDYLIRNRPLNSGDSRRAYEEYLRRVPESFPQKEAALFVLRELTGEDRGKNSAPWRELLTKNGVRRQGP